MNVRTRCITASQVQKPKKKKKKSAPKEPTTED